MTRPARRDEMPQYGQVWSWGSGPLLMAIAVEMPPSSSEAVRLVAIVLETGEVEDAWHWTYAARSGSSGTMEAWNLHE